MFYITVLYNINNLYKKVLYENKLNEVTEKSANIEKQKLWERFYTQYENVTDEEAEAYIKMILSQGTLRQQFDKLKQ